MSASKYDHKVVEKNLYDLWKKNNLFEPTLESKNNKTFSIILPPPNVTGKLHLGHAWDGALQDCLIRFKKMTGFRTAWIPGTDHAGISTQTKFENILREKGIDPKTIPPKEFLNQLSAWAMEQSKWIHNQWASLGFSLAYDGETFTLDKNVNELVNEVFIALYDKKLIYQDYKLVNWDIRLKTAISDIEVVKKPTKSKMYFFKYFLDGSKTEFLPVATTRPETMFGDTNLFVNPTDKRFKKYINKYAINPVNNQKIKILADSYVDKKFGTGVMKCTPAHDFNDFDLAKKHKITKYFSIMNQDGSLNEFAKINNVSFSGIDRLIARNKIVDILLAEKKLIKIEDHENEVGHSERTNEIVEPLLSKQWFVKMKTIANDIVKIQKSSFATEFYPKRMNKSLIKWLDNIQDWCISRQLLWGHKIPVWYNKKEDSTVVSASSPGKGWIQDTSVLDTWFSSGLWPIATTIRNKNKKFSDFFPVDVLVTAYDILFFWVARMLFQCHAVNRKIPLKNVLIHGLIRDEQNRKMSKSLNNGIDPQDVINNYGADALRMFLISSSTLGDDLRYSEEKIKYYWSFINKLWNAKNLVKIQKNETVKTKKHEINKWILSECAGTLKKFTKNLEKFNFVISSKTIIDFTWDVFCNGYLEISKPLLDTEFKDETAETISFVYREILKMLHPLTPFVTEKIYKEVYSSDKWLVNESLEIFQQKSTIEAVYVIEVFESIRNIRIKNSIKKSNNINIYIDHNKINSPWAVNFLEKHGVVILESKSSLKSFGTITTKSLVLFWENDFLQGSLKEKTTLEIEKIENEVRRSKQILANKNFLAKAPKEKVLIEQKKLEKYEEQLISLKKSIKNK